MIIKPSDLEKMVKEKNEAEAREVENLFIELEPTIDSQLRSYSNLFEEKMAIPVTIEYSTPVNEKKLIRKITDAYGTGEDSWTIVNESSDCKAGIYRIKFKFTPKPKTQTRK